MTITATNGEGKQVLSFETDRTMPEILRTLLVLSQPKRERKPRSDRGKPRAEAAT